MVSRPGITLVTVALFVSGAGCKKPPPNEAPDAGRARAADHLAKGEIPEGREKAYALNLPMTSVVLVNVGDAIEVESQLTPEELSNFVRARVKATKITAGADRTTFEDAIVPAEPKRVLHIEVRPGRVSRSVRSSMLLRDVTPLPAVPKVSDEDAYRKAGRAPDGKPLDPNHMF